ncbi:MAG: short-chain fatty acyl-CoA regulator family protein [Pseudomonadota bacterium]
MADQKIFAGPRIRRIRSGLNLTQTAMAEQLGISASYLNLIERNQRPLTVQLLLKLASTYKLDLEELQGSGDENLMAQLKEAFSDPLLTGEVPDRSELIEFTEATPNVASAMVKLYRGYRESLDRLSGLSSMMAKEGNEAIKTAARLPVDEMRQAFEQRSPYIPAIEQKAEEILEQLNLSDGLMAGLNRWLREKKGIVVQVLPVEAMPDWRRRFDKHSNRLMITERLSPSDQLQEVAQEVALLSAETLIEEEVAFLKLTSDEARRLARFEFARLLALAMILPYQRFLSTARKLRYDINVLRSRFGVTFAQAAWRLTMLQKRGHSAVPFFVMETDAAGNRIRRAGSSGFPVTRFGGDCPKLVVHQAFGSPGQIFAEAVVTPQNAEFIVIGRTVEGLRSGYFDRPQRTALLVGFDIAHADDVIYGDGLSGAGAREPVKIGPGCRLCERPGCITRAHPPLTRPLGLDEMVRGFSAFEFQ